MRLHLISLLRRQLLLKEKPLRATCCHTLPMWEKLDAMVDDFFERITLADLLAEQK